MQPHQGGTLLPRTPLYKVRLPSYVSQTSVRGSAYKHARPTSRSQASAPLQDEDKEKIVSLGNPGRGGSQKALASTFRRLSALARKDSGRLLPAVSPCGYGPQTVRTPQSIEPA
ncbi:hypothetical protein AcV7_006224 [Taiwanofungus camphoratus]|nr:hypothetical protein AcV7_006224 [Antrodia cinnamomea]